MTIYVTYLTIYSGNKIPPFYIGSTNLDKINHEYRGSVLSKKYKNTWKKELKEHPELFKTVILSKHYTRKEAFDREIKFHESLRVHKNPLYINMATANALFHIEKHSYETRKKQSISRKKYLENPQNRASLSQSLKKYKRTIQHNQNISNALKGKKLSINSIEKREATRKQRREAGLYAPRKRGYKRGPYKKSGKYTKR